MKIFYLLYFIFSFRVQRGKCWLQFISYETIHALTSVGFAFVLSVFLEIVQTSILYWKFKLSFIYSSQTSHVQVGIKPCSGGRLSRKLLPKIHDRHPIQHTRNLLDHSRTRRYESPGRPPELRIGLWSRSEVNVLELCLDHGGRGGLRGPGIVRGLRDEPGWGQLVPC